MKAVLIATDGASELWPLTELISASLLPVADKPLLVHAVESLAMAGLADALVVIEEFSDQIKSCLGDGSKWGMHFEYQTAQPGESLREDLRRIVGQLNDACLLVESTYLRTPIIGELLAQAATMARTAVTATIGGVPAGVSILGRRSASMSENGNTLLPLGNTATIEFPKARLLRIDSVAALHRANLDLIAGHFPGLLLSGRQVVPGVRLGRQSLLLPESVKGAPVFVGARCRIAASAEVMSHTIISSDSIIDRDVTLHRAVIMPGTYVGRLLEVSDAIVAGNLLIHVDTGTHAYVTDPYLLSPIQKRTVGALIRASAARAADRIRPTLSPRSPSRSLPAGGPKDASSREVEAATCYPVKLAQDTGAEDTPPTDCAAQV